jgi:hypothetical protein
MTQDRLWPLLLTPIIWVLLIIVMLLSHNYLKWPDASSTKIAVLIVVLLGLIPLILVVLDFAASRRAVLDVKGIKIDFSQGEWGSSTFGLPDNIGVIGTPVPDSSPMQITSALEEATRSEVALLDLKEGDAWWVTRLLALSAGAVRAGTPRALVFVGTKENIGGAFLGWAEPAPVLRALLKDKPNYETTYHHAASIAKQIVAFDGNNLLPYYYYPERTTQSAGDEGDPAQSVANSIQDVRKNISLHQDVQRYAGNQYVELGEAAFEQIVMDQLALKYERPPDRLTIGRLQQLLEHCLYRDFIDLGDPGDKQVLALLEAKGSFIALVRRGRYEGLLETTIGQRTVLQQLFTQRVR